MTRAMREAEEYINNIPKFTHKHDLQTTRAYLDYLGAPDRQMRIIHVAGTNGKGSVCKYISRILRSAGYHTGLFVSPHLVDIRERMVYDDAMISAGEFVHYYRIVREAGCSGIVGPHPTFFEFLFLMAMLWYGDRKPDWLVLETGLGGRLDATNAVADKELTVITRIGMDHMQYLGNTLSAIAAEKAGIIREKVPVITVNEPQESFEVIKETAQNLRAPLYFTQREEYGTSYEEGGRICFIFDPQEQNRRQLQLEPLALKLHSPALYQSENASLAVLAASELKRQGVPVTKDAVITGLESTIWPGRMEEVRNRFYLDGAHNEDGVRAFLLSVSAMHTDGGRVLLFSAVRDKAYEKELQMIMSSGYFERILTAPIGGSRALTERELKEAVNAALQSQGDSSLPFVESFDTMDAAVNRAIKLSQNGKTVFAAGSLYLVGRLKEILESD